MIAMSRGVNNKLFLYADDSDKHKSSIEKLLKKELEMVSDWLIDNKLYPFILVRQNQYCLCLCYAFSLI